MAGAIHYIESSTNGLKQHVDTKTLDAMKALGWKGKVLSTKEAEKTAKVPEEVKDSKK